MLSEGLSQADGPRASAAAAAADSDPKSALFAGFVFPTPILVLRNFLEEFRLRTALLESMFIGNEISHLVRVFLRFARERCQGERKLMNEQAREMQSSWRKLRKIHTRGIEEFFKLQCADVGFLPPKRKKDTLAAHLKLFEAKQGSDRPQ